MGAARLAWPSLVMTSPETMFPFNASEGALRHGNGRFANGDDMNTIERRQPLSPSTTRQFVIPIKPFANSPRRLYRLQRGEEELANSGPLAIRSR